MMNRAQAMAVERMKRYIERNLQKEISLVDLAKEAGYSPWHSSRIFKVIEGESPFEYIRKMRLIKAADIVESSDDRIIDIAFDFYFSSHEGFTRAFSRMFGMTPSEFRKTRKGPSFFCTETGEREAFRMNEDFTTKTVFTQVIEKPKRKLIVKRGIAATDYFQYCEEVGCEIWDVLCNIQDALSEPMGLWLPESMISPGTSKYIQGVEVAEDYTGDIPVGFDVIELKPSKIMIFQGEPYEDEEAFEIEITIVKKAIKRYNPELYGFVWDNTMPRFQYEPRAERGYIEGIAVKEITRP